jgi:hypothetical protein
MIQACYRADLPFLLHGRHGIGKSQVIASAAESLGIDCVVLDLSIMEPVDLIGLPFREADTTRYAAPISLPRTGRGLLVLEELNRSPRYMMSPCLQLLTARRLNEYRLPPGWLPAASVNPSEEEYHTEVIDPALLSRFVLIETNANQVDWLKWARIAGIHEKVMRYVESDPNAFHAASPRSWEYLSRLEISLDQADSGLSDSARLCLIAGLVGPELAAQYLATGKRSESLLPWSILAGQPLDNIGIWLTNKRTDLVQVCIARLKEYLDSRSWKMSQTERRNFQKFLAAVPEDLVKELRNLAAEHVHG